MPGKPKVTIDKDGDGDTDVEVEIDNVVQGTWPPGVRDAIATLVGRMEVTMHLGTTRITYASARETLRGLLANNP